MSRQMSRKVGTRIVLFILLATILVTFGIQVQEEQEKEKIYHLIFVPKTIDSSNDFWTALIKGAELGAEEFGAEIEVVGGRSEDELPPHPARSPATIHPPSNTAKTLFFIIFVLLDMKMFFLFL